MVLGLRTKNRKGTTVQVDYVIHIQEIKPWPPSQSLRSLRSVLLQFENGERHSGSTSTVVPSVGSGVGDGKIEFNESFRFPVTLCKELSMRGGEAETFQKNCLELNLYEPRRDKNMKGQLLGNAVIDLAEYGIIKEAISISTPMNCKRSFRNTTQPVLRLKIQPFEMEKTSSSPRDSLAKETSLDKDSRESVSALMSDEYAEEAEIASFTDDDVSSHSSNADLLSQNDSVDVRRLQKENVSGAVKENRERSTGQPVLPLALMPVKSVTKPVPAAYVSNKALKHNNKSSSRSSSVDLSSDPGSSENDDLSASGFSEKNLATHPKKSPVQAHSSSSTASEATDAEVVPNNSLRGVHMKDIAKGVHEVDDGSRVRENAECPVKEGNCTNGSGTTVPPDTDLLVQEKLSVVNIAHSEVHEDNVSEEATSNRDIHQIVIENKNEDCCRNGREEILEKDNNNTKENDCSICHPADYFSHNISNVEQTSVKEMSKISQDAPGILSTHGSDVRAFIRGDLGVKASTLANGKAKHGKMSVRSSLDSSLRSTSGTSDQYIEEVKEIDMLEDACKDISDLEYQSSFADKVKCVARERQGVISGSKIRELELRIENLEGELREAAALEVGLYSVIAEHGISAHKVHAPARRLSRMYIHACKHWSLERRASAARSALSGLVLVAKACGNDVPRLAFWLSNSIVLRAIISEAFSDSCLPNSVGLDFGTNGFVKRKEKKSSPLRWKETAASERGQSFNFTLILDDWHDAHTFTAALEKIESWIFSRIIESVWWQTLTPHMQSPTEKGSKEKIGFNPRKSYGRISSLGDQYQESFSTNLWKRAFKDAYERLCPVRAGGHECGCLPVLARLVMEQCVARLDVAMFNAILRESVDEIPTDPVSDPISDSKVLPIPVGKSSFGVGAQLKNSIGTWSRWLTDLFGIDADDSPEEVDDERHNVATSFKSFHLLNALSDLLMLPKDMLLDKSIRKEVCPTFGAPLIKRILWNFVPDEFCPDPIPEIVLEALASEDSFDPVEESIENYPCGAAPIVYLPPSAALVSVIVGNLKSPTQLGRSRSSVLRKSHTSDDELENLDSPLASIAVNSIPATTGRKLKEFDAGNGGNLVRYQLLRQVWMDGD